MSNRPIGDKTDEIAELAERYYGVLFGRAKNILRYWAQFHLHKTLPRTPDKEDWFMLFDMFLREFSFIRFHRNNERYFVGQRYNDAFRPPWPMVTIPKVIPFGRSALFSRHHRPDASKRYQNDEMVMAVKVLSDMIHHFTLLKRSGKIGDYRDYSKIVDLLKQVVKPLQTPLEIQKSERIRQDTNRLAMPKQIRLIF